MKTRLCEVCGNEITSGAFKCSFCDSPQYGRPQSGVPREKIRTVNIKAGMPIVEEALRRLGVELSRAGQDGVKLVRIVHGWGSTGTGGKLRVAIRTFLASQQKSKRIKSYLAGDKYSRNGVAGRKLLSDYPELKKSERTDSGNPGITFVEL